MRRMTPEDQAALESKPLELMRCFAASLHWNGLQLDRVLFTEDEMKKWNVPSMLAYYMTTDEQFNLQINERDDPPFTHQATVKPWRYGIRDTGWHQFTLSPDLGRLLAEAERLRPWLDRTMYKDRNWRRQYKRNHPERLTPSGKRRRGRQAKETVAKKIGHRLYVLARRN